jgi:protein-tyrosine phosphatase
LSKPYIKELIRVIIMKLLFVCTGNTCRSPMAECIMKAKNTGWDIESAGISADDGHMASENAIRVMEEKGLDLTKFRSKMLTREAASEADLIITMTRSHADAILLSSADYADKVSTIYKFAHGEQKDVTDPYGGDFHVYKKCADELTRLIDEIALKLGKEDK